MHQVALAQPLAQADAGSHRRPAPSTEGMRFYCGDLV